MDENPYQAPKSDVLETGFLFPSLGVIFFVSSQALAFGLLCWEYLETGNTLCWLGQAVALGLVVAGIHHAITSKRPRGDSGASGEAEKI